MTTRVTLAAKALPLALACLMLAACRPSVPDTGPAAEVHAPEDPGAPGWVATLDAAARAIDDAMPGDFGVYVRRLGAGPPVDGAGSLDRGDDRAWYLSSTIKVPVAIAVLEEVDAGRLSLEQSLTLAETDFVDGAGDMLQHDPGDRFTVAELLEKSLVDSDSTATDMLIRLVGEDHLNARVRAWAGTGFGPMTTILQVRYDAYGTAHAGVADLSNRDILALRNADVGEPRLVALAERLGVSRTDLDADNLDEVFARYYDTGRNAATLEAFAVLLERLVTGDLLSPESTAIVLGHMRSISTGDRRIQAGLPRGADFAQKTGTQFARACNVGVIDADRGADGAVIVAACAEDYDDIAEAEQAFEALGRALDEAGLVGGDASS
ncbi:serine hydrolase [Luteimonas abyssi]|uniref:serine hydrolase n=1 Tax=Luteimonas abyssi TaxID=1247514 RepID=UPI000737D228|nr:serine hydrolase [Luteimonas abyssi]